MAKQKALVSSTRAGNSRDLFDRRPIALPGFRLVADGIEVVGRPTLEEWGNAFSVAKATEEASPIWVGELWNYAEGRTDWRKGLPQILADIGLPAEMQTIYNAGSVAKKVTGKARQLAPSYAHMKAVASLPQEKQIEVLEHARTAGLGSRDTGLEVRALKRRGVIEGRAVLEGMFRAWEIDCPWKYNQLGAKAHDHYAGMTLDELLKMGDVVRAHTAPDAVAFFWVTAPFLYYATDPDKGPDPYRIIRAWGFEPKTGGVWDKVEHNFGNYLSIRHEHLIIATRGNCTPDRPTPMFDSVFTERANGEHSKKPESVGKMIERMYDGPYVQMFAFESREGWTTFGDDPRLWAQEATATA
jgi:N6-adenosine-specific RNA methylase IME4